MKIPAKVANKAKQISVLLMDVDGTLTDGSVTLASTPDNHALEIKTFDAHDGQGLSLAVTAGLRRSEEHTSELQSLRHLVCRLLLEKKKGVRTKLRSASEA